MVKNGGGGGDNSVPQLPVIGTTSFLFLLELILSELLFYFLTVFEWSLFGTPGIHLEMASDTYRRSGVSLVISIYRSGIPLPISLVGVGWS